MTGSIVAAMRAEGVTRVLIADDHPVYVDGLAATIDAAPDLQVVATCDDGTEALARIRADAPDVAVLDLHMPGLPVSGLLQEVSGLPCRILVLTVDIDGAAVHDCLSFGAAGYVTKGTGGAEICDAIRAVAAGGTVLSTSVQASVSAELRQRRANDPDRLNPRELEILGLLATGASAPDIASTLYLSTSTVKSYLHQVYGKLGVSDRAAAVAVGMRRGLIG
jgi:two-component system, NarL family, nitrate/nitrite response regulator NarL